MPDFITLAQRLRAAAAAEAALAAPPAEAPAASALITGSPDTPPEGAAAVGDLALLRVAAKEAYMRMARRACEEFAGLVLARELAIAPAALDTLAARVWNDYSAEDPVQVRFAPGDTAPHRGVPSSQDPSLAPGDLVVDVRDGTLDLRFALRVSDALECAFEEAS